MDDYTGNSHVNREGEVEKVSKLLGERENTIIHEDIWKSYPREWQTFLEQISDFLAVGREIWWKQGDHSITFYDGADMPCIRPEGPPLHHFRSWSIRDEEEYLTTNWRKCLDDKSVLPNGVINIYDTSGNFVEKVHISINEDKELDEDEETKEDKEIEEEYKIEEVYIYIYCNYY